jgi:polyhydroxyalkanoate synthesis regulator protein
MQGFMGSYIEKNVQAFTDMQAKLADKSKQLTPEMWAQFMSMQNPDDAGADGQLRRAIEECVRQDAGADAEAPSRCSAPSASSAEFHLGRPAARSTECA